jgi:hypothetical protein
MAANMKGCCLTNTGGGLFELFGGVKQPPEEEENTNSCLLRG